MSVSRSSKAPRSVVVGSLFDAFATEASVVSALQRSVRTQSGQRPVSWKRGENWIHDAYRVLAVSAASVVAAAERAWALEALRSYRGCIVLSPAVW